MVLSKLPTFWFSSNNNHQWMKFSSNLLVKPRSPVLVGDRVIVLCNCFKEFSKFKSFGGRDRVYFSAKQIGSGRVSETLESGGEGVVVVIVGHLAVVVALGEVSSGSLL
ncbi:hypothetical protein HN51_036951 [Arachis hypogaea]